MLGLEGICTYEGQVTRGWKKPHNQRDDSYVRRWAGLMKRMEARRNAYGDLIVEPEGKRPLLRGNRRWERNIKIDIGTVWREGVDWIRLAQDRSQWRACMNMAMNLRVL
jgi:hypothetical protein